MHLDFNKIPRNDKQSATGLNPVPNQDMMDEGIERISIKSMDNTNLGGTANTLKDRVRNQDDHNRIF